ncbi:MAG: epoxyqueuosine reductase QueH [Clostridiales bacterium]
MKILLHCCCGPCACGVLPRLDELGHEVSCYFYNPNIHPYQEHQARMNSFLNLMELRKINYYLNSAYPLEQWLATVADNPAARCAYCYENRLQATAALAKSLSFAAFSTTLLVSPYQDQQKIVAVAEQVGKKFDIPFFYEDFRPWFREGQAQAHKDQLYLQK